MESDIQASNFNRMIRSAILTIMPHALIPLFWFVLAVFIAPRFVVGFVESGFEIPPLTHFIIKISDFMSRYWFVYLFVILLLLVADGAIYFSLLRSSGKIPAGFWSMLVLLVEGIFTVLCIIALCLPLMRIISGIE